MTWIICQTLFHQNVEIENSPNFNDIKVSRSLINQTLSLRWHLSIGDYKRPGTYNLQSISATLRKGSGLQGNIVHKCTLR